MRWKRDGALLWLYTYRVCHAGEKDRPQAVVARHGSKGAKEQGFSEVPSGLDPHRPPCKDLMAKQAYDAITMLTYKVLVSLRTIEWPDNAHSWRIWTMIRYLLTVPGSVRMHARYEVARICIPGGWLRWC